MNLPVSKVPGSTELCEIRRQFTAWNCMDICKIYRQYTAWNCLQVCEFSGLKPIVNYLEFCEIPANILPRIAPRFMKYAVSTLPAVTEWNFMNFSSKSHPWNFLISQAVQFFSLKKMAIIISFSFVINFRKLSNIAIPCAILTKNTFSDPYIDKNFNCKNHYKNGHRNPKSKVMKIF